MNKKITFRGTEHSRVIEEHIHQQLAKIENFLEHDRPPYAIDMVLEMHPTHAHNKVDLQVKSASYSVVGQREGQDIYRVIDETIDVVYRELLRAKERLVDQNKKGTFHRGL